MIDYEKYPWVPWRRYCALLTIDSERTVLVGRYRLAVSAINEAKRLRPYAGYMPQVIDSKKKKNDWT
jgi:hypothetical protein